MYLLAGVRRLALVPPRCPRLWQLRHWSGHQLELEFPGSPCWLRNRRSLKAQVGCKTLPASGVQAGTDFRPAVAALPSGCQWVTPSRPAASRPWLSPATVHRNPGPWFVWLQLQTWVSSWASSQHRRQGSGQGKKTQKGQSKLGRSKNWSKTQVFNSLRFKVSCTPWLASLNHHDWRSCEFLVLFLFSLFNYNKT